MICLVTDRRRLSKAFGADLTARVVRLAVAAAEGGIDLVQLRERDLDAGPLADLAARCLEAVAGSATRIVVNERLDVALACGVHGVHLRSDSCLPARVRPLVPSGWLIGRSVHGVAQAVEYGPDCDYLVFGTVFPSRSKPAAPATGVGPLADACRRVATPILAIGGVGLAEIPEVARAGAAGFAAIGLFAGQPDPESVTRVARAARQAFDTARAPA